MASKTLHKDRKQGARVAFTLFDESIVNAALALASTDIQSEQEARELFSGVAAGRPEMRFGLSRSKTTNLPWVVELGSGSFGADDWQQGQSLMQKMLPLVSRFDSFSHTKQKGVRDAVNKALVMYDFNSSLQLQVGPAGLELRNLDDEHHDSIAAACARSLIPFLIPEGWPPARIGKCQYRNCGAWFLRPPPQRGSVPLYCSPEHATSERVTSFRERQRKAAAKPK